MQEVWLHLSHDFVYTSKRTFYFLRQSVNSLVRVLYSIKKCQRLKLKNDLNEHSRNAHQARCLSEEAGWGGTRSAIDLPTLSLTLFCVFCFQIYYKFSNVLFSSEEVLGRH